MDSNPKRFYKRPNGAVNTHINNTFYLGRSYEYAYDKWYWTIGIVRFYNSTFRNNTDIFAQTNYIFFEDEWPGSKEYNIIFRIDPKTKKDYREREEERPVPTPTPKSSEVGISSSSQTEASSGSHKEAPSGSEHPPASSSPSSGKTEPEPFIPNEPVYNFFDSSAEQYFVSYDNDFAFDSEKLNVNMTKPRYSDLGQPGLRIELHEVDYNNGIKFTLYWSCVFLLL